MADVDEYRCFIGNLSWSTTDESLKDAFRKFGNVTEAKVVLDKFSGRSRGFAFVTFDEKKAMEEAIEEMNGLDLEGRAITVDKAQPQGPGRDRNGDRDYDRDRGSRNDRGRDYGGGRAPRGSGGGGDCFKCGKPGHFARECPDGDGGRGDRYGGRESRDDRYGGGSRHGSDRSDRGSDRSDRGGDRSDRGGDRSDCGGDRSDRGGDRSDRGGDRYSGRSRDGGSGGDRYSRDRSGPY